MEKYNLIWTVLTSVISALVVVAGWVFTVGKKFQVLDDLKEGIKNLREELQETRQDIKIVERNLLGVTGAVVEIQTVLTDQGRTIRQQVAFTSHSPIELTEFGEDLMKQSGFSKIINDEEKKKYLVGLVKAKNPQNNYDIQEFSTQIIRELTEKNDQAVVGLKNYAYEQGLVLELLIKTAGLVLRNEVMKELKFEDKV